MDTKGELSRRQQTLVIAGLLSGVQMVALSQGMIGTAMPQVVANLGEMALYGWTFTTYMLFTTSVIPIFGKLSDIYGRKRFFLLGLATFMAGSLLSGTSQTMLQLVIFRSVQGVGAGIILPLSLAAVADVFPPAQRTRILGLMATLWGLSSTVGPIIGGYVADNWGWPWAFYLSIPVGLFSSALCHLYFRDRRRPAVERPVDYLGVATLMAAVVPLLLALSLGGKDYAWNSPLILGFLSLAGPMLALFLFVESRAAEPIIPLALFRNSVFSVAVIICYLSGFALFGLSSVFLPLYLQGVIGITATSSGLLLAPMTLGMVMTAIPAGHLIGRIGYRKVGMAAMALQLTGAFLLATLDAGATNQQAALYMLILGLGWGPIFPVYVIASQNAVRHALLGVVTSSIQFLRNMGFTMGVSVMGALLATSLNAQIHQQPNLFPGGLDEVRSLLNPSAISDLSPLALSFFRQALAGSLRQVFLIASAALAVGFLATLFLKDLPLRKTWETTEEEKDRENLCPALAPGPADLAGEES